MIGLLQRVSEASVRIDDAIVGRIDQGLLVLLCAERGDMRKEADALLNKLLTYRVFSDAEGKMNLNVSQVNGGLLLVPQFTLAADTRSGTRPSFTPAAPPTVANELFDYTVQRARQAHPQVETGRFGADMKVALINDGPVTFWLRIAPSV
ncbi:MAG: D-tyrosyl-tRNA(Tyr) deacylase [Oxalobacteraceae bacterium]|nr:D-tyrosyl-tRNA(Tyr) deacylase [Oxalobacteraceae bacterium]